MPDVTVTYCAVGDLLWTDANARQMVPRRRNWRRSWPLEVTEPVAGNFYPITSAATLRGVAARRSQSCSHDDSAAEAPTNATAADTRGVLFELSVVTDRTQGVASLSPGSMHILLHRRLLQVRLLRAQILSFLGLIVGFTRHSKRCLQYSRMHCGVAPNIAMLQYPKHSQALPLRLH